MQENLINFLSSTETTLEGAVNILISKKRHDLHYEKRYDIGGVIQNCLNAL